MMYTGTSMSTWSHTVYTSSPQQSFSFLFPTNWSFLMSTTSPLFSVTVEAFQSYLPFLPQCLHLSHVLSYFEGFSECSDQLNYIAVHWPSCAHDFMHREHKVYWQPWLSPKHNEVWQITVMVDLVEL